MNEMTVPFYRGHFGDLNEAMVQKGGESSCSALFFVLFVFFRLHPRVSGYFLIRNFFFPDSKISLSTRSVFKSNSPVHTHPMVSGFTVVPKAPLQ